MKFKIEHDFNTFDLFLCAGLGIMSQGVKKFQRLMGADEEAAEITHVAMFYRGYLYRPDVRNDLVFESTLGNKDWVGKSGVQVNSFDQWFLNYHGKIYYRRLIFKRTPDQVRELDSFVLEKLGTPYETGIPGALELLTIGLRIPWLSKYLKSTVEIHCTELIVQALQNELFYDTDVNPSKVSPYKWCLDGDFEDGLKSNIEIAPMVRIK